MELSTTAKRRASLVGVLLLVVTFVVFASRAQGNVVPEPDLHDGGIWVTNEARGLVGRTNAEIATVDAKLSAGARDFDVLQSGNVVVAPPGRTRRRSSASTLPRPTLIPGPELSAGAQVGLGAETAALFDPDSGGLFIVPATSSAAVLALDPASDIEPSGAHGRRCRQPRRRRRRPRPPLRRGHRRDHHLGRRGQAGRLERPWSPTSRTPCSPPWAIGRCCSTATGC